jgi:hypothetical protein
LHPAGQKLVAERGCVLSSLQHGIIQSSDSEALNFSSAPSFQRQGVVLSPLEGLMPNDIDGLSCIESISFISAYLPIKYRSAEQPVMPQAFPNPLSDSSDFLSLEDAGLSLYTLKGVRESLGVRTMCLLSPSGTLIVAPGPKVVLILQTDTLHFCINGYLEPINNEEFES